MHGEKDSGWRDGLGDCGRAAGKGTVGSMRSGGAGDKWKGRLRVLWRGCVCVLWRVEGLFGEGVSEYV